MKLNTKSPLFLIAFGVILFAVTMNLQTVLKFLADIIGLGFPILLGLIIAFVLNVPMTGFEHWLNKFFEGKKHKLKESQIQALSLLLTLLSIILVIALAFTMLIPALVESVRSIYPLVEEQWPKWAVVLESYEIDVSLLTEWISSLDVQKLSGGAGNLLNSAMKVASTTISGVTSTAFGFVIAIYGLLSKKKLAVQVKKLTYANLDKNIADHICNVGALVRDTYTKFLSGQCVEAIILGCLIGVAYSLFRLPYAGLIGFLTGICAFVPYIGAFLSCSIGALLILLAAPEKVLICIIVYMVVQFIENQFIYPHVVGTSVGLAPLWTLLAALIGGKLFGLPGIIFFIPLMAVLYQLVRENTNRKLKEKGFE